MSLARRLARRYARSRDFEEDLVQVASLGLVKAVDRYDLGRGKSFANFAVPTILGEIRRHFRDTRWALHVPRDLQEIAQRVARETELLRTTLRRAPTTQEVAQALDLSPEEVLEARAAFEALDAASLDAPTGEDVDAGEELGELLGSADERFDLVDDRVTIEPLLTELPGRERTALVLRFELDMTQSEIGDRLGVSQMQVSRMLRRSLSRLRDAALEPAA
jgi:RNA polymerase sigma-B factor